MEKKSNLIGILIGIVAVVIIGESVFLVTNLSKSDNNEVVSDETVINVSPTPTPVENLATINLSSMDNKNVIVSLKPTKSNLSMDAISLYLKYNPEELDISNLKFDSKLPKPSFSKVSTTKKMLVINYLITSPKGFELKKDSELILARFDVQNKKKTDSVLEINMGDSEGESVTMIVEAGTSKVIPFNSNKLIIKAAK